MHTEDTDDFEARPAHRRIGTYLLGIFIAGLATSILIFILAMQGMGWPPALLGSPTNSSTAQFSDNSPVLLYVSRSTSSYFGSIGGNYETLLKPWRGYIQNVKPRPKEVNDLSDLGTLNSGVLILPSTAALGPAERQDILAFRDRGGSVLATWATGTRGANGEWMGWDFLEKLGGARFSGEIPREADVGYLVLSGESPVNFSQSAGKRIFLGSNAEHALRLTGPQSGGQFLNWARTPEAERAREGAITYAEIGPGAGRVVIFGFAESSWENQTADLHQLVNDTLSWLKHKPVLVKANWPDGKRAAQVIEMDTEQGFPNSLAMARMMKDIDYRGSFFVLTSSGLEFPDVLKTLNQGFEIGYHGDTHLGFKGQSQVVQEQRLTDMKAQLQTVIGGTSGVRGFRAPTESYDKSTQALLLKSGLSHHLSGTQDSDNSLPFFAPIPNTDVGNGLVVLPRSQRDDINLLAAPTDVAKLAQAMIDDFNLNRDNGSLGLFSVHSQNFGEGQAMTLAMPNYLNHVRAQRNRVWLVTPSEIDTWWRDRERFQLIARPSGPRIEFDLSVGGDKPIKGASLTVMLPKKGLLPIISGVKSGMPLPTVTLTDDYKASIIFDTLAPGNYFYQATF